MYKKGLKISYIDDRAKKCSKIYLKKNNINKKLSRGG